jgi:hypothetical protein
MKFQNYIFLLALSLLISGCGTLKINPEKIKHDYDKNNNAIVILGAEASSGPMKNIRINLLNTDNHQALRVSGIHNAKLLSPGNWKIMNYEYVTETFVETEPGAYHHIYNKADKYHGPAKWDEPWHFHKIDHLDPFYKPTNSLYPGHFHKIDNIETYYEPPKGITLQHPHKMDNSKLLPEFKVEPGEIKYVGFLGFNNFGDYRTNHEKIIKNFPEFIVIKDEYGRAKEEFEYYLPEFEDSLKKDLMKYPEKLKKLKLGD